MLVKETVKISLENSFAHQKQIFEFNSKRLHHHENPEIIHQLRLSLKRIRSIQGFMEFVSPSRPINKKNIDHLNNIFKLSGNIRDNQIQLQDLQHIQEDLYYNFKHYEKYLDKKIEDSRTALSKKIGKYDVVFLDNLFYDFIGFLYSRTERDLKESYRDILEEKFASLEKLMKKGPGSIKSLHSLRQKVKDYLNLYALLNKGKSIKSKDTPELLKLLDHNLGRWHDLVNTRQSLKDFFKKNPGLMLKNTEYQEVWFFVEDEISKSREGIEDLLKQGINHG